VKVAVVTGATSGIGRAAALALADDGWWVLANGRDQSRGDNLARELARRSGGVFVAGDLRDEDVPRRLVDRAVQAGPVKAVVASAGTHVLAPVTDMEPAAWDELMTVNLRSAFLLARAAIPALRDAGGGAFIGVASEAGLVAVPSQVAYNVSKAALVMLAKSIAVDYAADGIRALSVCPGTTRTPLVDAAIASASNPAEHEEWLASSRPARRLGTPEEIAAAIVFAAGDAAAYMTGCELVVDGGYTAI
jgi:NAD(P)-dependent dehydrogenase (short-subunit alcohol dehydrogenase family)